MDYEPLQNPESNHEQFILPPCQRLRASLSCRNPGVPTESTKLPAWPEEAFPTSVIVLMSFFRLFSSTVKQFVSVEL